MNPRLPPGSLRAFRRNGKLVLEIDEHRFCADAFHRSTARIIDRDAFLGFSCDHLFKLLHDENEEDFRPTWWVRFSQAMGEEAARWGAGVRRNDGTEVLPIDQPPDLFPDEITRTLLGPHIKPVPDGSRK